MPKSHLRQTRFVHRFVLGLIVCALPASVSLAREKPKPDPVEGKIDWGYSYDEGRKLAAEEDKPLFIVFRCER